MTASTLRATALAVALLLVAVGPLAPGVQAAGAGDCSFPVNTVDATGTSVSVDAEPTEVVTLAPSAAQTMWEIGAKGKVVAVSSNADYLSGTSSLTTITTYPAVDAETVVNLDPDLVLAPNAVSDEDVERLRSLGLTVYKFEEANDVEDVYAKTRLTGRLVGACDGADATVADMKEQVGTVRDAVEGRERPPVFYHMGGGWTAGSDTFIHEIITTAGGENVGATAGIGSYQVISSEVLVSEDPEWFVRGSVPVPSTSPYSDTAAGKENQVVVVNSDYINQPAPRIVYPLEAIAEALHPGVEIDLAEEGGVNADLTGDAPTFDSEVTAAGGRSVAVSGLYTSRSARLTFPGDADRAVAVRSIGLTLREPNPSFLLTVADGSGAESPPVTGTIQRFSVTGNGLLPAEVEALRLRLHVGESALDDRDVEPADLTLYRFEAGEWQSLETGTVRHPNGTVAVTANASNMGEFALGWGTAAAGSAGDTSASETAAAGTAEPTTTAGPDTEGTEGTATATPAGTTTAPATTTSAPGQPGFGIVLACLGVLVATGLRRRGRLP